MSGRVKNVTGHLVIDRKAMAMPQEQFRVRVTKDHLVFRHVEASTKHVIYQQIYG